MLIRRSARAERAHLTRPAHASTPERIRTGAREGRLAEWTLSGLALLAILVWLPFLRWFDLAARYETPFFALEKLDGYFDSAIVRRTLLLFIAASVIYIAAVVTVLRTRRLTTWTKVALATLVLGPALICLQMYPIGALDVFNYLLDLRLAYHYGENPYVVTNPDWLTADAFTRSAFMTHVPLFYGPAWLLISAVPGLFVGFDDVVPLLHAMKVMNLALLGGAGWLIARAQPTPKRAWLAAFVFLGNPLVLFEGVVNAHNDVLMTIFTVAAFVAVRNPIQRGLSGPALALAVLVKSFAAVLIPLVVLSAVRERWPRWQWLVAGAGTVLVSVVTIAPFWDGGAFVDGMRTGTTQSQKMDHVSPLSLAQQRLKWQIVDESPRNAALARYVSHDVVPEGEQRELRIVFGIAFALLTGLTLVLWLRNRIGIAQAGALTMILFSLLMTNLYPWYLIPIVALLALSLDARGLSFVFVSTLLGLAYYPAYVWAHFNSGWDKFSVHLLLAIFLTAPMVAYFVVCAIDGTLRSVTDVQREPGDEW